jgi:hypothetical protein
MNDEVLALSNFQSIVSGNCLSIHLTEGTTCGTSVPKKGNSQSIVSGFQMDGVENGSETAGGDGEAETDWAIGVLLHERELAEFPEQPRHFLFSRPS